MAPAAIRRQRVHTRRQRVRPRQVTGHLRRRPGIRVSIAVRIPDLTRELCRIRIVTVAGQRRRVRRRGVGAIEVVIGQRRGGAVGVAIEILVAVVEAVAVLVDPISCDLRGRRVDAGSAVVAVAGFGRRVRGRGVGAVEVVVGQGRGGAVGVSVEVLVAIVESVTVLVDAIPDDLGGPGADAGILVVRCQSRT